MHSSLRSFNFWRVILIGFLVSVFVYMLMPLWPAMLEAKDDVVFQHSGWTMLLFCIGLFMPGPVSSYLLDRYRRKDVCLLSIGVLVAVSLLAMLDMPIWLVAFWRLMQGAAFALFHISLGSTILIDITISERRDVAAYMYFWTCKFALAVGPAIGLLALHPAFTDYIQYVPIVCALLAFLVIFRLDLPFRTPMRNDVFSMDRFWLRGAWPLVLLQFPVVMTLGVEMALNQNPYFYSHLLVGFLFSLVLHFVVFSRADIRAEIITGLIALLASFLLLLTQDEEQMVVVASVLSGYGVGNVTGRLLSFFTMSSHHTERGSAQMTYKLTFESALCLGFFLPCVFRSVSNVTFYIVSLVVVLFCILFYLVHVNKWFVGNVKR